MISISKFSKDHNVLIINVGGDVVLVLCVSSNHAGMCTKFHENISKGFRVTKLTQFLISKFSKGHNSVNNIGRVMVLVLNTYSNHALYL